MDELKNSFAPTDEIEKQLCAACGEDIESITWDTASFKNLEIPVSLGEETKYISLEYLEFYMNTFGVVEVK